jgi:hypothetical protein
MEDTTVQNGLAAIVSTRIQEVYVINRKGNLAEYLAKAAELQYARNPTKVKYESGASLHKLNGEIATCKSTLDMISNTHESNVMRSYDVGGEEALRDEVIKTSNAIVDKLNEFLIHIENENWRKNAVTEIRLAERQLFAAQQEKDAAGENYTSAQNGAVTGCEVKLKKTKKFLEKGPGRVYSSLGMTFSSLGKRIGSAKLESVDQLFKNTTIRALQNNTFTRRESFSEH